MFPMPLMPLLLHGLRSSAIQTAFCMQSRLQLSLTTDMSSCRRLLQLLAKHRMPAYRERVISLIRVSAPRLLRAASECSYEPPQVELSSELGPRTQATRGTVRVPLLPPSIPDNPSTAALATVMTPSRARILPRSVSNSRWQLPPPFSRASGQRVPVAVEVEGSCLETVTSVHVQSREGELWPYRIAERPQAPCLASAEPVRSERAGQQQPSWAQWMAGLVASGHRSLPAADTLPECHDEAPQILRMHATIPYETAQSLVTQQGGPEASLRSDFGEESITLSLNPHRVWIIAEDPRDALTFLSQLAVPPSGAASAGLTASLDGRYIQEDSTHAVVEASAEQPRKSRACNTEAAPVSGLRLRKPFAALAELQRRAAAGAAALRQPQHAAELVSGYGSGVRYETVMQPQRGSFEARLQADAASLQQHRGQQQQDSARWTVQLLHMLRVLPAPSAAQRRASADAVLILLQPAARVVSGAASQGSAHRSPSSARPERLQQLLAAAASADVPVLVVLSGSSPWSPWMGADLTAWARSGASVLHVQSLSVDPQAAADSCSVIQHAVYRLLAGDDKIIPTSSSKL